MAFLLGLITSAPVGFAPTAWAAMFDASFIAGVRALQKQDFAAAVRHLQAALQEDPDSLEARKFLAIAQFQAVANKPDDPFRDAANQAIAELRAKQPAPSAAAGGFKRPDGLSGSVQLALEYDSNVATAVDESTRGASAVDDARLVPTVNLSYDKPVGDRYYRGAGMLGFANFYEDEAQRFELQFLRADIHAGIVGQSWDLKRGYEYDVSVFDYDKALVSHRLSALYINLFSPRFVFVGLGSVARDLFAQNPLQDAIKGEAQWWSRIYLPELVDGSYAKLRYKGAPNETDDKSVFTYYANKVTLGYHLPLPWWSLTLDADANHEWRRYDEPNPNDRRDRTWEWSLTLGKKWTDSLSSSLQVKRQQTGSTVASFSRRRYVYGAKLKYAF